MEYRTVIVTGRYDFDHQVALRNQDYHMLLGAHLLTPLKIDGGDLAVVVDRGWIPQDSFLSGNWERFNEPGTVQISGVIRLSESEPQIGSVRDPVPARGSLLSRDGLSPMCLPLPGRYLILCCLFISKSRPTPKIPPLSTQIQPP